MYNKQRMKHNFVLLNATLVRSRYEHFCKTTTHFLFFTVVLNSVNMLLNAGDESSLRLLASVVDFKCLRTNIADEDDEDDDDDASTLNERYVAAQLRYASPQVRAIVYEVCQSVDNAESRVVMNVLARTAGRRPSMSSTTTALVAAWRQYGFDRADDVYSRVNTCISVSKMVVDETGDETIWQIMSPTPHLGKFYLFKHEFI
jgi:hypothetical protein